MQYFKDASSLTSSADPSQAAGMVKNAKMGGARDLFKYSPMRNVGASQSPAQTKPQMDYQTLNTPDRQALLQAMITRARGGQPGGAPTAPLPVPNSNIPTNF